jgi:hypothetical protein
MKKDECEQVIRQLCHQWRSESGFADVPPGDLQFSGFLSWMEQHHSNYLRFRSGMSVRYDVEQWFDQEFKQMWRR